MTERLFTPPHPIDIPATIPLLFLEGPVQGAPDWQNRFGRILLAAREDIAVAFARRTPEDQARFDEDEQVAWEDRAIERAKKFGGLGVWWAAQDLNDSSYPEGRAYAQTTRFELGEAWEHKRYNPDFVFVNGIDPEYSKNGGGSEGYIRRRSTNKRLTVCNSEEEFLSYLIQAKFVPEKDIIDQV